MKILALTALLFASPLLASTAQDTVSENAPTPAQRRIEEAATAVAEKPAHVQAYNDLAFALARRGRETADPIFYERAEEAVRVALTLDPGNYQARKHSAWVLLGQHRFEEALELARALNGEAPDDVLVYGFLVDALVELGQYGEAERQCQWMLDLRPGNVPALTRAAYLRELFGDVEGALDLMVQAYHGTDPDESEDRAWILTQMGHLHRSAGRLDSAASVLDRALALFPDYHYALAQLGQVRLAQGRAADAAILFERRYELAPHPENRVDLARSLVEAGRQAEATELYRRFVEEARAESEGQDNANRELALHLAQLTEDEDACAEALRLARRERERRADVWTREVLAWALLANGHAEEARQEIEVVLAIGRRGAELLLRAGAIAAACGEREVARERLRAALALHPEPAVARAAEERLDALRDS